MEEKRTVDSDVFVSSGGCGVCGVDRSEWRVVGRASLVVTMSLIK